MGRVGITPIWMLSGLRAKGMSRPATELGSSTITPFSSEATAKQGMAGAVPLIVCRKGMNQTQMMMVGGRPLISLPKILPLSRRAMSYPDWCWCADCNKTLIQFVYDELKPRIFFSLNVSATPRQHSHFITCHS